MSNEMRESKRRSEHHPRRGASAEAVPGKRPVDVGDAAERARLDLPAEEDLVGRAPTPGGVRPVSVVPEEEVGAEAVELGGAGEKPEAGEAVSLKVRKTRSILPLVQGCAG
jgi:hypothetical protein